jgi:hypothetical protein
MAQIAKRKTHESWRDAVAARAREFSVPAALDAFDAMVRAGRSEAEAAYRALAAHELLWPLAASEPSRPAPQPHARGLDPDAVPEV